MPAVTHTNTIPDAGQKQGMSTLRVALIAAALGSAVAALITLVVVGLGGEEAPGSVPPKPAVGSGPSTPVTQLAAMEPAPDTGAKAPGTPETPSGAPGADAPGEEPSTHKAGGSNEGGPLPGATNAAGGDTQAPAAEPQRLAVGQNTSKGPERSEPAPSALDVANGSAKPRSAEPSPAEVEVLRRYAVGDVASARKRARAAKLTALDKQLARFEAAESAGINAFKRRDVTRAITHLTLAVALDEELVAGRSSHGPNLRRRLADLHVQSGIAHAKAGRADKARAAFEEALKHNAGHREAQELRPQLDAAAAP